MRLGCGLNQDAVARAVGSGAGFDQRHGTVLSACIQAATIVKAAHLARMNTGTGVALGSPAIEIVAIIEISCRDLIRGL